MLIEPNGNIIIKVVNDKNKPVLSAIIYNKNNFFNSIFTLGETGLGESFVSKDWTTDNLTLFLNNIYLNHNNSHVPKMPIINIIKKTLNYDKKNIKHHYDIGNDFYKLFLRDDLHAYSCGFWLNPTDTLNDAQYNKVNTIIKKLNPKENSKILDIGCGWGEIANYISKKTKSIVYGITISDEQVKYANDLGNINIRNMDYRRLLEINEKYDHIYSIGMLEHVRYENYDTFFNVIKHCLNDNGRCVIHTIISMDETPKKTIKDNTFITKHIFPGGQIPQNEWIIEKIRNNGLNLVHSEIYGGQHYAKTINVWKQNMKENSKYIINNYSEDLLLQFEYYMSSSEAGFNTGMLAIGHYVIVKEDILSLTNSFNYELN